MARSTTTTTPPRSGFRELPAGARVYVSGALVVAAGALAAKLAVGQTGDFDPVLFAALAVICGGGNLFEIFMPGHWSFQPNMLFFFAGAILLPAWATALIALACFAPGYLVNRRARPESFPWYKVAFNIANYLLAGLAAHELARIGGSIPSTADSEVSTVLALFAGACAFAAINHLLILGAVWVSRERSLGAMARQLGQGFPLDTALCLTGAALAVLWDMAPALVLLAPGPILLMYRALSVPLLSETADELRGEVGVLQAALLPTLPARLGGLELSVAYQPAEGPAAGGDFYDAFPICEERTAIVLGDASGHGRDAIARSVLMRYTLRAYLEAGLGPRAALRVAGRVLDAPATGEDFATVIVAIHDTATGTLTYACAGHPAPVMRGPAVRPPITACSSPPVGVGVPTGLRQTTAPFAAGSTACLFTDGIADLRIDGRPLGREGLESHLADLGAGDAAALLDTLATEAGMVRDDMAACVLRASVGEAADLAWVEELECDETEIRGELPGRFLRACGLAEQDVEAAVAALREARRGALLRVRLGDEVPPGVEVVPQRAEPGDRLGRPAARRRRAQTVAPAAPSPQGPADPPDR